MNGMIAFDCLWSMVKVVIIVVKYTVYYTYIDIDVLGYIALEALTYLFLLKMSKFFCFQQKVGNTNQKKQLFVYNDLHSGNLT